MKKYLFLFLSIILISCFLPCKASPPRLVDDAHILTQSEKNELNNLLDDISENLQCDVIIVTMNQLNGKDVIATADDYFDENGYGQGPSHDGILFLISMAEREWAISTCGQAIQIFTDRNQEKIMDSVLPALGSGSYGTAFRAFAQQSQRYIEKYIDAHTPATIPERLQMAVPAGLIGGAVIALIIMLVEKNKLKTVRKKNGARYYVSENLRLNDQRDMFLYRHVTRRDRPKETPSSNSFGGSHTHMSSSGRTHGGSHGHF